MSGVTANNIEPRLLGAFYRIQMPAPIGFDIRLVHGPRLNGNIACHHWHVGREDGDLAAVQIGGPMTVVGKFYGRQGTVFVNRVTHTSQIGYILVRPKPPPSAGCNVRRGMDFYLFGRDNRPATLCLDAPHCRHAGGKLTTHSVAMRGLIEPVPGRHWPDLHGLRTGYRNAGRVSLRVLA